MAKLWSGVRVEESALAFAGRHAWLLSLPFVLLGATGWMMKSELLWLVIFMGFQVALYGAPVALVGAAAVAYVLSTKRYGPEELRLDDQALHIGKDEVPRSELASAWCTAEDELEIITHGGDEIRLKFQVASEAAEFGAQIRAAADRSRSYAVTNGAHVRRVTRKTMSAFAPVSLAGLIAAATPWGLPALPIAGLLGWLGAKGVRRCRFGADGIAIEGRFKSRFVPYRAIERVDISAKVSGRQVRLVLDDGTDVLVLKGMSATRAELIRALIAEGIEMVQEGENAGAHLSRLERGGDDDEELQERLRAVANDGNYRGAAIQPERLQRLMRNPASPPEQRVAAAVALRATAKGRAQIRVAAEVSAEPDVKEALEALAEEEVPERQEQEILRRFDP